MIFNFDAIKQAVFRLDWLQMIPIFLLCILGVAFIYSAKYQGAALDAGNMHLKQILWIGVGSIAFFAVAVIDYRTISKYAYAFLGVSLVLLCLVFLFPPINNAQRWIPLVVLDLQPSEVAKLSCLLALATYLSPPVFNVNRRGAVFATAIIAGAPFVLVFMQPDLGTAVIFIMLAGLMLFARGLYWRTIILFAVVGLALLVFAFFFLLEPYQQQRILTFLSPGSDPTGTGWNAAQSKIAVASGGPTGKGFLQGTQNTLGFLPRTVAPTDFIFSVIGEEAGFVGSATVIGLFALLFFSIYRAAILARDMLGRLIAVGVLGILSLHVFVNIGMTVGAVPITGLPLPLVSYGGSFMVSTMVALGLVQSVSIRRERR